MIKTRKQDEEQDEEWEEVMEEHREFVAGLEKEKGKKAALTEQGKLKIARAPMWFAAKSFRVTGAIATP
jgi:hypothetical protein